MSCLVFGVWGEANLCLMPDVSTSKAEPTLDASSDDEDHQPDDTVNSNSEKVIFESREDLIKGYNQLLFAFAYVSKAYRKLNKCFQNLERQHGDLKKQNVASCTYKTFLCIFLIDNQTHTNSTNRTRAYTISDSLENRNWVREIRKP